jgi:hypothetical protein
MLNVDRGPSRTRNSTDGLKRRVRIRAAPIHYFQGIRHENRRSQCLRGTVRYFRAVEKGLIRNVGCARNADGIQLSVARL